MNILVVDDHQVFLQGLIFLLENNFSADKVFTANTAMEALTIIEQTPNIDLLIIDIGLPEIDGCAFLQSLNERNLIIPSCVISATEDISKIHTVMNLGAMGFIPKEWDSEQIVDGLEKILQGQIVVPDDIQKKLHTFDNLQKKIVLSKRQRDVLVLLKDGLSNSRISEVLNISPFTVKSHVSALFQVFDAENRMECVENAKKFKVL
ncbi:MAG: response regulator transcription factor [gamma proteobacterium symbiont of Taylorina sp.]|nr:response regulator transcription factor [gamma proteobacterium symbiont of Taylorina sp.]